MNTQVSPVVLTVSGDLSHERLAAFVQDFASGLREAGVEATPLLAPTVTGERGDAIVLGQLALGFVTGGAATALVECLKVYLSRERKAKIIIKRENGEIISVDSENIKTGSIQEAVASAARALEQKDSSHAS